MQPQTLRAAAVDELLRVGQGRIGWLFGAFRAAQVGDYAESARREWEKDHHAVAVPVGADFVIGDFAVDMHIGQNPIVRLRFASELQSELLAGHAMSTVAADEPGTRDLLRAAISVPYRGGYQIRRSIVDHWSLLKTHQLHRPLDGNSSAIQILVEHAFSFVLRNHQRQGKRRVSFVIGNANVDTPLTVTVDTGALGPHAGGDEILRQNQLCRTAPVCGPRAPGLSIYRSASGHNR